MTDWKVSSRSEKCRVHYELTELKSLPQYENGAVKIVDRLLDDILFTSYLRTIYTL